MIARARERPRYSEWTTQNFAMLFYNDTRALFARYLRVTLHRMGGNPAMHLSIVKLSRFIRMMDRSPGRRNLAQFVTRANFVRAEPARVAAVSFDGVNAHEKRTNCTAIEFHGGFLQGFHRRRSLPRDRKDGCLHSDDPGDYIVATRCSVADGKVKIIDCNAKCIATSRDEAI